MIALACDHGAVSLKEDIKQMLVEMGYEVQDFGTNDTQSVDYPVYAEKAARAVQNGTCELGIVMCGTGIGMSLAANKVKGIRCALCSDCFSATMAREHNNANMIALGARVVGVELAKMMVKNFLNASFLGGRHQNRVDLIMDIENR